MSKYKFNDYERYAVWKTLGPKCQWCKEPVEYKDSHIDHIIPESLLENATELKNVFKTYKLDKSFNINSFENWIPTHPSCNQSKNATVLAGAPIILQLLEKTITNKKKTENLYLSWKNQSKTAKLESIIKNGIKDHTISKETVNNIFLSIDDTLSPVLGMTASTINNQVIYIPSKENWVVISTDKDFYTVRKGEEEGILPLSDTPDPEWLCDNCKNYGPWDGNKCLNCNQTSFD